jgi:hypothetical protein
MISGMIQISSVQRNIANPHETLTFSVSNTSGTRLRKSCKPLKIHPPFFKIM